MTLRLSLWMRRELNASQAAGCPRQMHPIGSMPAVLSTETFRPLEFHPGGRLMHRSPAHYSAGVSTQPRAPLGLSLATINPPPCSSGFPDNR